MQSTLLLLVLWDLSRTLGASVPRKGKAGRGTQNETARSRCGGKVKVADFEQAVEDLIRSGALSEDKSGRLSLTPIGHEQLSQELLAGKLAFWKSGQKGTVVGAKNAQAVLNWLQYHATELQPTRSSEKIASYEVFQANILAAHEHLNREYQYDNLVPIYQLRRHLGDRIDRAQFDEWLVEMQGNDILQLEKGDVSTASKDQVEDSIKTKISGLRFYAKAI